MSEWLDLMLEEISRKERETKEAEEELRRREAAKQKKSGEAAQSK